MFKERLIPLVLLTFLIGSGCSKKDNSNDTAVEKANSSSAQAAKDDKVIMGDDPNAKFTASQTTINSFESSNTFNNYGFAYHYEIRSGDGQEHFYKSIQEFTKNDLTDQRNLLAENWVEITKQEWLETKQHYDQTGEILDLNPRLLKSTPLYQKLIQFLNEQQARQAEFEKQRADFNAEFNRQRTEFDKSWNESNHQTSRSSDRKTVHEDEPDNSQPAELDQPNDESQKPDPNAL